jgi:hypothetical protein
MLKAAVRYALVTFLVCPQTIWAGAPDFMSCKDPEVRQPMTVLASAFFGPRYDHIDFEYQQMRFQQLSKDLKIQAAPLPLPTSDGYLEALETASAEIKAEALAQMMWEVYGAPSYEGSIFRLPEDRIARRAAVQICQVECPSSLREHLVEVASAKVAEMKANHVPRRSFAEIRDELNTNLQGAWSILSYVREEPEHRELSDYWVFLTEISTESVGKLLMTETARGIAGLPLEFEAARCVAEGKCGMPTGQFDAFGFERALREFYDHMLYEHVATDVFKRHYNEKQTDEAIVKYYRYFPMAVGRVASAQPQWSPLYCKYLAETLAVRGEEVAGLLGFSELLRLAPMASMWLFGLGGAMIKGGGMIPGFAFAAVTAIEVFEIAASTVEINHQNHELWIARGGALSGQMDVEGILRYLQSRHLVDEKTNERNMRLGVLVAANLIGFGVGRVVVYGLKGFMSAEISAQILSRYAWAAPIQKLLKSEGVSLFDQGAQAAFLARATPAQMREISKALTESYERSVPATLMAMWETQRAFNYNQMDYREHEKGL